jgi:hypothetical protein
MALSGRQVRQHFKVDLHVAQFLMIFQGINGIIGGTNHFNIHFV